MLQHIESSTIMYLLSME